jgi:hypothetical protein
MPQIIRNLGVVTLFAAAACTIYPVHRDAIVQTPVVLPNNMCAAHGKVAVSTDKPGERMICELQEPLGTHLAKCTCWDEGLIADKRIDTPEAARQYMEPVQTRPLGPSDSRAGR